MTLSRIQSEKSFCLNILRPCAINKRIVIETEMLTKKVDAILKKGDLPSINKGQMKPLQNVTV